MKIYYEIKNFPGQILILIVFMSLPLFNSCTKNEGDAKILTTSVTEITATSARVSGDIIDLGNGIENYGHCWNLTGMPDIYNSRHTRTDLGSATETGSYLSELVDLAPNTLYYVRAFAEGSGGIVYGSQVSFRTNDTNTIFFNPALTYETITDIEGNKYRTIQIGSQTWMAENLKSVRYTDNSIIPLVSEDKAWEAMYSPGYCWYNNDSSTYKFQYGALYNWYAVNTDKLCPSGWHIPTTSEWKTLVDFLGGPDKAFGKLKERGSLHWMTSDFDATNASGFTALPSGYRFFDGPFDNIRNADCWWLANEYNVLEAFYTGIHIESVTIGSFPVNKTWGFSVRCIMD
jgi:uncharacterized protein (TIGR02145 family)